jgi:protein TonB
MAQDFLRDVLRTGDASAGARRRLSILPVSIAAHAVAVGTMLIAPLAAEVEPPIPRPLSRELIQVMPTVMPPMPQPPRQIAPQARVSRDAAPVDPPPSIEPERPEEPSGPPGPAVEGAIPLGPGGPPGAFVGPPGGTLEPLPLPPPPPPRQPIRISDGIRAPRKLVDVPPMYPAVARQARVEGIVILEAIIDERGNVDRVRVLRSVPLLDEAAMRAVRSWRYTPTLLNGVPVPVLMTVSVHFTLRE